jgi:hypothetical protein
VSVDETGGGAVGMSAAISVSDDPEPQALSKARVIRVTEKRMPFKYCIYQLF